MIKNKRFTVDGLTIAENSPKGRKYLLEHQGGVNALCNRINGLFDKSKRLEKEKEELQFYLELNKTNYNYVIEQLEEEIKQLSEENKNLSKLNKIIEGFLLDKGYDFKDIIKFLQEKTDGKKVS